MLKNRIIPCLDVKNGRVVKGINFVDLKDAGDPVEQAKIYSDGGADEICFLDITASNENRDTIYEVVEKTSKKCFVPLTVGGGVRSVDDINKLLNCGADKVSINTAAVQNAKVVEDSSRKFGSQCIVVAIDAKYENNDWYVYLVGGRVKTEIKLFDWAKEVENRGAGEILFTSMDHDGTKNGFSNKALSKLSNMVKIPVIASGGAGKIEHFIDVFNKGCADAALAASVFHFNEIDINTLKKELKNNEIPVRL